MRLLLCAALALAALPALPALAQNNPEVDDREVEIEIETDEVVDGPLRIRVERDGEDGHVIVRRRGDGDEDVYRIRMPEPEALAEMESLRLELDDLRNGPLAFFNGASGPFSVRGLMVRGVSDETRERMNALQSEARDLAREARRADGAEREAAVRRLDAVLADLFEVRAEARREEAEHLRERARELQAEADEMEAGLRDRAARRQALIDARHAELLGETPTDDW